MTILTDKKAHASYSIYCVIVQQVRTNVSDFAVLISIIIMVLIDALCGLPTPKLTVPTEFKVS